MTLDDHGRPATGTGRLSRSYRWRAAAGGSAAALVAATVLMTIPPPWPAVVLALLLLVFAPSATRIDRRVALNLSVVLGVAPLVLFVPPALGARSASAVLLALATGAAAAALLAHSGRLVPTVRPRDTLVALMGALAGLVASPLGWPGDPQRALVLVSTGIDNAYHYAMYLEQRLAAAGSPLLAANADPTGFAFDDYPQWFHRMLTVLAQIGFGGPAAAPVELVRYAQLQWLVFVLLAVLVTAAFLQALPDRVDPTLLAVVFVVLGSMLLGVPGALNLLQGHLSFLVAASAPLVMFLLAFGRRRPGIGLFVVLGGLVLVTASWLLLLPMAAAALLPPVIAVWRRQHALVRWGALAGVGIAGAAAFVLFVLYPLTHGGAQALLRDGTIPEVRLVVMLGLLFVSVSLVAVLGRRSRTTPLWGHLVLVVTAALETVALGGYMLAASGELTYYFWKLGLGTLFVAIAVVTHAAVLVRTHAFEQEHEHEQRLRPVVLGVALLAAAAGLGVTLRTFAAPSVLWAGVVPVSLESRSSTDAGDVALVLRLAESTDPPEAARTRLLATRPEDMNAAHASEWFHALSHSATRRAVSVVDGVYELALDPEDVDLGVELALSTLDTPDGVVLVTDPELYRAIAASAPSEDAGRVTLVL
jgi:hypothetical protein